MADELEAMDRGMLGRAAAFFSGRPQFLGYWLDRYREVEEIEPSALARLLGCPLETVDRLAICFTPRQDEHLEVDVRELAERFTLDPDRLADVLLAAWGAEAARPSASDRAGTGAFAASPAFAAASDRQPGTTEREVTEREVTEEEANGG